MLWYGFVKGRVVFNFFRTIDNCCFVSLSSAPELLEILAIAPSEYGELLCRTNFDVAYSLMFSSRCDL